MRGTFVVLLLMIYVRCIAISCVDVLSCSSHFLLIILYKYTKCMLIINIISSILDVICSFQKKEYRLEKQDFLLL